MCVVPDPNSKFFQNIEIFKMSISMDTIEEYSEAKDFSNLPKNIDFDKINLKIDRLHKKTIDIMKTQNYQILKEGEFSQKQIENSSIVVYMTIIQVFILMVLTVWQVVSFKHIFNDRLSC